MFFNSFQCFNLYMTAVCSLIQYRNQDYRPFKNRLFFEKKNQLKIQNKNENLHYRLTIQFYIPVNTKSLSIGKNRIFVITFSLIKNIFDYTKKNNYLFYL